MKNVINLEIDDQALALLLAALYEMHHEITRACQYEHLAEENKTKLFILRNLTKEIAQQCDVN